MKASETQIKQKKRVNVEMSEMENRKTMKKSMKPKASSLKRAIKSINLWPDQSGKKREDKNFNK